jgi:hypothetical protein
MGSPSKTKPVSPSKTKPVSKTKKSSPSQTKPDSPKKTDSKTKPEPATATEYNFDDILNITIHKRPHCLDANLKDLNSFFNANNISSKDRYKIIIHILLDNIENNRCIPETADETANPNKTLINEIETNYKSSIDQKLDEVKQRLRVKIVVNSEIRKNNEKQREKQEKKREEQEKQKQEKQKQEKQKQEKQKQEKQREEKQKQEKQREEKQKQEKQREEQKKEKEEPEKTKVNLNKDCPSFGKNPKPVTSRLQYYKQALTFHPDKNSDCKDLAREKFQQLNEYMEEWKIMEERKKNEERKKMEKRE